MSTELWWVVGVGAFLVVVEPIWGLCTDRSFRRKVGLALIALIALPLAVMLLLWMPTGLAIIVGALIIAAGIRHHSRASLEAAALRAEAALHAAPAASPNTTWVAHRLPAEPEPPPRLH